MTLTIAISPDAEKVLRESIQGDVPAYMLEAVAVDLYRNRKITHGQIQRLLSLSSFETDEILKRHGGVDDITPSELEDEVSASNLIRRSHR